MNCKEFNQVDMVDYLAEQGHCPAFVRSGNYWYLSPLREEKTPSFKVNRKFNVWYDHGLQKGGNLIDFGILFHRCIVNELLQKLEQGNRLSFHPPILNSASFPAASEKERLL